ncbi:Tol-Pal system beta propeller repeat protein TolB [bacterium]|nr:Tol-Pal system beta propeller repeat protein TolB [bacterium]
MRLIADILFRNKAFVVAIIILTGVLAMPHGVSAIVYLDINAPEARRLPVAVQSPVPLEGSEPIPLIAREVREVIAGDLDFSGVFRVLDPVLYMEDLGTAGITADTFLFDDWELINAEALVKVGYLLRPDGDVELEFHLFDVFQRKEVTAKRWKGSPAQLRNMAHMFSNEIMRQVTGEEGVFVTRILFVQATDKGKEIYAMDYDGANVKRITRNGSINLSPEWWPDDNGVVYTSYKHGEPDLFSLALRGGEERIADGIGVEVGADFSPDGRQLAFMKNNDGNPDIYITDTRGKGLTRITWLKSVEASPTWSPDGKRMAFVSDRYGSPQIFVMNVDGSGVQRVTLEGSYNSSPAWSPSGDLIAYTNRVGGSFGVALVDPETLQSRQLVGEAGNNEDPAWSPDGRYISFSSDRTGTYQIYIVDKDGRKEWRFTSGSGEKNQPAWSSK